MAQILQKQLRNVWMGVCHFRSLPQVTVLSHHPYQVIRDIRTTAPIQDIYNVQDEEDFKKKVLNSSKPVVVQFHADWCGPCKQLGPRLETIVGALKNEPIDMAKVNIDDLPDIALEYNVGAVPSVLGVKQGKVVDKFVGLQDEDKIQAFISKLTK